MVSNLKELSQEWGSLVSHTSCLTLLWPPTFSRNPLCIQRKGLIRSPNWADIMTHLNCHVVLSGNTSRNQYIYHCSIEILYGIRFINWDLYMAIFNERMYMPWILWDGYMLCCRGESKGVYGVDMKPYFMPCITLKTHVCIFWAYFTLLNKGWTSWCLRGEGGMICLLNQ